jgi:glucosamine-6-phosphate deaminase
MSNKPILETKIELLKISVYSTNEELGLAAAVEAKKVITKAIKEKDNANIIVATGNSQLTFLKSLSQIAGIDWSKVNIFHMDEYVGINPNHPASFPLFLKRHFLNLIKPKSFHPVPGNAPDIDQACREYETLLREHPVDLTALGIGENGHLAFNDPPYADFHDPVWMKKVKLDDASRRQQVGEGHFKTLAEVPTHALTLTIPALLAAKYVLAIVPESRKLEAVKRSLLGPIQVSCPATILRQTAHAHLFLDQESAAGVFNKG